MAIRRGDRTAALALLRDVAEGRLESGPLDAAVGDALIATARGPKQDQADRLALARMEQVHRALEEIMRLLTETPFGPADLSAIRSALEAHETAMRVIVDESLNNDMMGDNAAPSRRVGSVWLEVKYIPDGVSGRQYGPYLYGRWREGGRKRSRYIGKG